jgi:hypothetical protein
MESSTYAANGSPAPILFAVFSAISIGTVLPAPGCRVPTRHGHAWMPAQPRDYRRCGTYRS